MIPTAMPAAKRSPGRPTIRTPEIEIAICDGIANGKSLYRIVGESGMPSYATVCVWLSAGGEFLERYAAQADFLAEEIIEIADGTGNVQRDRLRIEARMWYAGKLRSKKYGTKCDGTTVNVGVGVAAYVLTEEQRTKLMVTRQAAIERNLQSSLSQ